MVDWGGGAKVSNHHKKEEQSLTQGLIFKKYAILDLVLDFMQ